VVNLRPIRAEFCRFEEDLGGLTQRFTATHQEIPELRERFKGLGAAARTCPRPPAN
jgi:hypothetical protein